MYNEQNVIAQSKSRHNKEVCTKSSIVLLLTLIGHDMVSFTISLGIHYKNTFHYINYKTITMGIETLYDVKQVPLNRLFNQINITNNRHFAFVYLLG